MKKSKAPLYYFDCVGSTNDVAKHIAESAGSRPFAVCAKSQFCGRGSSGAWLSPVGGVYLSCCFAVDYDKFYDKSFTLPIAKIVNEYIAEKFNIFANVVPPNDIISKRKKLAGILSEVFERHPSSFTVIVGVGLNVEKVPELSCKKAKYDNTTSIMELIEDKRRLNLDGIIQDIADNIILKIVDQQIHFDYSSDSSSSSSYS